MVSLDSIREDLKDVRYYYMRKKVFEGNVKSVGVNVIREKVDRYNSVMIFAPPKLYDLYIGLYVNGSTQDGYATEIGYTPKYIQKRNKELLRFLQENLKKE